MFDDYFDVYLADTSKGKEEHYKLRYKVYCEEMGFEDKRRFASEQEKDHWDEGSVHFLVRHRETGEWVGAMRMVFQHDGALPFQEISSLGPGADCDSIDIEISRLCLVENIRRRKTDEEPPLGLNTTADIIKQDQNVTDLYSRRQINRSLIWGLIRAASLYSEQERIDNWYFLCTKALARALHMGGLKLTQVGDVCHHRGERYPFKLEVSNVLDNALWSKDYKKGYQLFSEFTANEALFEDAA